MRSRRKVTSVRPISRKGREKGSSDQAGAGYPVNERQVRFCVEYVQTWDVQDAALKAGFSKDYARSTAYALPAKLMAFIKLLQGQKEAVTPIIPSTIVSEYQTIAFANLDDYEEIYEDGNNKRVRGKPWATLTRAQKAAVEEIYYDKYGQMRYRLYGKTGALFAIGKYLGMFNDKLILERRNVDISATFNFEGVPMSKLLELEQTLAQARGVTINQESA